MKPGRINILYLDNEDNNLQAFKASFRKDYNIFTTTSAKEAEQILEREDIQIVLADQRMPGITGVQFFEKMRNYHSEPVRILITGYTDINAAIDSINKGEVFRFIDKPWDHEYVKTAIENAYDIYHTRKELKERNAQLTKAYEELDKFIYSASHDLRAPLMSILGIVQLAVLEKDEVKNQAQYLEMIEQAVRKLDGFILSIIDYYKNSRSDSDLSQVDFTLLVTDVKESLQFIPGSERIKFTVNIDDSYPFHSDMIKLRIIFNNLITNAVKYQDMEKDTNFVKIDVKTDAEGCLIVVEDNGVGIMSQDLDKIFNMFYRGTSPNSGSGIGLYIVHEAVEKLGGQVQVESKPGKGSVFTIRVPSSRNE